MSATTGRMSRADALRTLDQICAAAREFISSPSDNSAAALTARSVLHAAESERDHLDASPTNTPNAKGIRSWRTRVAALQAERFLRSASTPPRISAAVCVTLYGEDDRILGMDGAADIAAQHLGTVDDVRLQDSSHVRTATLTGTRYIFTSRTP
jgi:hypothetical protein